MMVVYAVHDVKADTWSFPQVSPTIASAVRDFKALRSRPGVPGRDLECVYVAEWLSDKGELHPVERAVLVNADPEPES